ncbi:MAG: ABC transporter ATP-binding protein [Alkalispirochaetaceae bacterium]
MAAAESKSDALLEVKDLRTSFFTDDGEIKAVDGVSFALRSGETLGIVGESGCGKSVTSLSIMRLLSPPGKVVGGEVRLRGENILDYSENRMRELRGKEISMIFQEPMTSLNPVFTVGDQIAEAVRIHEGLDKRSAMNKAIEMIRLVGIPDPKRRADQHPFELSGGMRQRIMIAMALACSPSLLIADEPTTALDVTIQAQILGLLKGLQRDLGLTVLLITHDLGVVAQTCDRVAVMYAGKIVEFTDVHTLFANPRHPYTVGLLNSLPLSGDQEGELRAIPGTVPSPLAMPTGCRFAPRCSFARELCRGEEPALAPDTRPTGAQPGNAGSSQVGNAGSSPVGSAAGDETLLRCWIYTPRWEQQPLREGEEA